MSKKCEKSLKSFCESMGIHRSELRKDTNEAIEDIHVWFYHKDTPIEMERSSNLFHIMKDNAGHEGGGEACTVVFMVENDTPKYFSYHYSYYSHHGDCFDFATIREVEPYQKIITTYRVYRMSKKEKASKFIPERYEDLEETEKQLLMPCVKRQITVHAVQIQEEFRVKTLEGDYKQVNPATT